MNDLLLKLRNILKGQEEEIKKINERQYLEYYRARLSAVDWFDISTPRCFPQFSSLRSMNQHALIYAKINLPINPGAYPRFICIDTFCIRHGIHDFSLHVPRVYVRTSIGEEGPRGFRLIPSFPTRHRFSIVECSPGAVTNLMKLFSV